MCRHHRPGECVEATANSKLNKIPTSCAMSSEALNPTRVGEAGVGVVFYKDNNFTKLFKHYLTSFVFRQGPN